jgi:hypothetical protein
MADIEAEKSSASATRAHGSAVALSVVAAAVATAVVAVAVAVGLASVVKGCHLAAALVKLKTSPGTHTTIAAGGKRVEGAVVGVLAVSGAVSLRRMINMKGRRWSL